jgi:hypothetical protein
LHYIHPSFFYPTFFRFNIRPTLTDDISGSPGTALLHRSLLKSTHTYLSLKIFSHKSVFRSINHFCF